MTGKTHIMGGVASCTAAAYFYGYDPVFMTASGVIGALIPDICHTDPSHDVCFSCHIASPLRPITIS